MKNSTKTMNRILIGTALVAMTTVAVGSQAVAADTYAESETQASLGNVTQMPGKTKRKTGPRKVNHAYYEVMAEKGIFIQPKRAVKTPAELAKRRNHADYDTAYDEFDG